MEAKNEYERNLTKLWEMRQDLDAAKKLIMMQGLFALVSIIALIFLFIDMNTSWQFLVILLCWLASVILSFYYSRKARKILRKYNNV